MRLRKLYSKKYIWFSCLVLVFVLEIPKNMLFKTFHWLFKPIFENMFKMYTLCLVTVFKYCLIFHFYLQIVTTIIYINFNNNWLRNLFRLIAKTESIYWNGSNLGQPYDSRLPTPNQWFYFRPKSFCLCNRNRNFTRQYELSEAHFILNWSTANLFINYMSLKNWDNDINTFRLQYSALVGLFCCFVIFFNIYRTIH